MTNVWALIVTRTSTREPVFVQIDTDRIAEHLGGTPHTLHAYSHPDATEPSAQFHLNADQQEGRADINQLATDLWRNHTANPDTALLGGDTLLVTGHDPHTGAATDAPEYLADSWAAIAAHLD